MSINQIQQNQNLQHQNQDVIWINGIQYQKIQQIGAGTEGIIYKGRNVQTQEIVAIKESQNISQILYQALQQIKNNNCSNIIGIKNLCQQQNKQFIIVMDYAHGEFFQFMNKDEYQKLTYEQKNSFFIQMVKGVQQLHSLGLFHRDLKPENFVYIEDVNKNKTIKLIDFGLVKQISNQLRQTLQIGTPYYMAPEILKNQGSLYDKSVDIWSLGVIWYEVLLQKTFINGQSTEEIFRQIQKIQQKDIDEQIEKNPYIQQKEKNFIKKMLRKDPQSRVTLSEILKAYNQDIQQQILQPNMQQNIGLPNFHNNGGGQQQRIPAQIPFINRQQQQKLEQEQETRNQLLQEQQKQMDEEKRNQLKRELERQIEKEYTEKYEKQKDDYKKDFENQIKIKENELKEQQQKVQQQEKNIELINQTKIQQEIQFQNEMNKFKKEKEEEQKDQMEKFKQQQQKEKEQKIQEKLKEQEEYLKLEIEKKYQIEYNQKIIQMESQQQQQQQQQLETKRQALLNILQSQEETINTFIIQLSQQLEKLNGFNMKDNLQFQLTSQINNEIWKHYQKVEFIKQAQQYVRQAQTQEILQDYEIKLISDHNKSVTEYYDEINKINQQINLLENQVRNEQQIKEEKQKKQQQLKKLEVQFQQQCELLQQQLFTNCQDIQKFEEKIKFYQEIQFNFEEQYKIQDIIRQYQKLKQDLQILQQKENQILQLEQSQKIIQYQFFISKLEELQYTINQFKHCTQETNQLIKQIDIKFIDKHQRLINEIQQQLNDYCDKFNYLSTNNKYTQQIQQIFNQTQGTFDLINQLNTLLNQDIFKNYYSFNQTYYLIQQQLEDFEIKHNKLNEQIQQDQQIQSRNVQRIIILENTQKQLNDFIYKMSNLKQQLDKLIDNQYFINEEIKKLIKEKSEQLEQIKSNNQKQLLIFQQLNQLNSCETINTQINELEQFQIKLKLELVDETEKVTKLQFLIQTLLSKEQSQQEKELLMLNNHLQQQFMEFTKAMSQIKIVCESYEFLIKMENNKLQLLKTQQEQKHTLENYLEQFHQNKELLEEILIQTKKKTGTVKNQLIKILENQQQISEKSGQQLEILFNSVNQQQIQFLNLDYNVIQTYEELQMEDQKLQKEINLIQQKISNQQQLNPCNLNDLKKNIQDLIDKLYNLQTKIPQNIYIQKFNNGFKTNLKQYEILYTLVNYVKQFHITRYYERIKEYKNKQIHQKKEQQKQQQQQQDEQQKNQNNYKQLFYRHQDAQLEENTKKEKEAQNLLYRYQNILFNDASKMTIDEMEKDSQQMDKIIIEQENYIKQTQSVKLKSQIKNQQQQIKQINEQQYQKTIKFSQMLLFQLIFKHNNYNQGKQ